MLSKQDILAAQDVVSEMVKVPEWGGEVRVRVMTGAARDSLGAAMRDASGNIDGTKYRARLLVRCIVGEDGGPLFADADVDALNAKNSVALDRLFTVADRINAVRPDAVETAEKN